MTNCIILTHAFIREEEVYKLELLEFAIKHWRYNNPNSYIILAGHGLQPKVTECDIEMLTTITVTHIIIPAINSNCPFLSIIHTTTPRLLSKYHLR